MIFEPHSEKQDKALFSEARITLSATGIQWGKTRIGAWRTKFKTHVFTHPDDAFIITAPTYKIMKQSTLPAFLQIMRGCGNYNKSDAEFKVFGGGTVYMRTETDPDSVVGITNVRHIWGDEAGKYSSYFWENLQGRAAFSECQIDLTTSPYSLNWIYEDLIKPHHRGELGPEEFCYVKAASYENPYFPMKEYERQRAKMDERRFRMMFGGEWERMEGLVYDSFDEKENVVDIAPSAADVRVIAGIDWGYTEPFAMFICALYPDGRRYQLGEVKRSRLTPTQIKDICIEKRNVFGIQHFFCGPDRPEEIAGLCQAGIKASAANNSVKVGIAKVYELIKARRLYFVDGKCRHTLDELSSYHYPEPKDISADKSVKEAMPVQQNDHLMDAMRYCLLSADGMEKLHRPIVPADNEPGFGQSQEQRIRKLHKKRRVPDE